MPNVYVSVLVCKSMLIYTKILSSIEFAPESTGGKKMKENADANDKN